VTERISVVIPAFDAARYVAVCLESVLGQTLPPDEVIVVDDGSTDDTATIVEGFGEPVRLLRRCHEGHARAVNHGVSTAVGSLLAFQDADDLWVPDKLERQCAALDADADLDVVFGLLESFVSPELPVESTSRYRVLPAMASYQLSTALMRREAFDRVGPLDEHAGTGVVLDWISRSRAVGLRTLVLDAVVARRRIHDTNIGIRMASGRDAELIAALRNHRRRLSRSEDRRSP